MSCNRILSLIIFLICSSNYLCFNAHARKLLPPTGLSPKTESEEKVMLKGQIGSRPPRCQRRCNSCEHCEAIQVPTNPQKKYGNSSSSSLLSRNAHTSARADDSNYSSNYKPMSWKCKCGNLIFNP